MENLNYYLEIYIILFKLNITLFIVINELNFFCICNNFLIYLEFISIT